MGLVEPQYSHCFLATEVDDAADVANVVDVPLESPFASAPVSSMGASTGGGGGGSDSASWELTRRPLPVN